MTIKKTPKEFKDSGMLFVANTILHFFGWIIVMKENDDESISGFYFARTSCRGFDYNLVDEGFKKAHKFLKDNIDEIHKETNE